jgi:hypothetical protein
MAGSVLENSIYGSRSGGKVVEIVDLGMQDKERIARYRDYWRIYKGDHWDYERGQGGDPNSETLVTVNYGRRIVDAQVNFLMKSGWELQIPDDPETPQSEDVNRSFIKHRLDKIWAMNDKDLFNFEYAQSGSVNGDAFLHVFWDEELSIPRVEVLPSQLCYPEYAGSGTRRRMTRCTVYWEEYENGRKFTLRGYQQTRSRLVYRKVITPQVTELYKGDELVQQTANPFGEVNVAHVVNYPIAGEPFGLSDLHVVMDLQKLLNETATDIKDAIEYHGSPVTILKGASVRELEAGANKVWSIPADADAKNLELSGDLAASNRFLETIMESIYNLSGVPKAALGGDFKITGTSAAAIAMAYMPMLETRNVKIRTYSEGLRKVNRLMLKATELKDPEFLAKMVKLPVPGRYATNIVFGNPLPRDEANALDTSVKKIAAGLSTRKRELLASGKSDSEASAILAEWREEQRESAQMDFDIGKYLPDTGEGDGRGNPNPVRPHPDVQGQKVSDGAGVEDDDEDDTAE